jgi:PAS domain-containing protein
MPKNIAQRGSREGSDLRKAIRTKPGPRPAGRRKPISLAADQDHLEVGRRETDLLRVVLENRDEGMIVFDKDPKVATYNKRFIELLGFEDGTIKIGLPWTKVVQATAKLGAYGSGNQKQILDARKHSHRGKFDTDELIFPDGTVLAIKRRKLAGGGFVSTFRDITRRRKRTAELQLALENLRKLTEIQNAILNALPSNIALLDDNAAVIAINKSWRGYANRHRLTAGAREGGNYVLACEYASGPFATVGTKIANGVRAVLSGKRRRFSCEYPFTDAGKERWFLMVSVPVGNGDIHGAIVSHTDITEQKRLQRNVIASEEHLRAIVESTGEAILTLRDDGTIASANTMTTTLFVYANKKIIGKHVTNLLPEFPFFQSISGIPGGTPHSIRAK